MKSKSLITILIIAIVGALAAAWYFMWYIPHTPAYTLKIIHQAVQDKDADEALRHIDTKSIVKNILEREGNKYIDTSNQYRYLYISRFPFGVKLFRYKWYMMQ